MKFRLVGDEHVANQPRIVDEEQLFARHPVRADVAVGPRERREEVERVRAAGTIDQRPERARASVPERRQQQASVDRV